MSGTGAWIEDRGLSEEQDGDFPRSPFLDPRSSIDLEAIYNQHAGHTHRRALEEVFHAGMQHVMGRRETEGGQELDELRIQYANLQQRYDALNAKFNVNQPTPDPETAAQIHETITRQALGMGEVFRNENGEWQGIGRVA